MKTPEDIAFEVWDEGTGFHVGSGPAIRDMMIAAIEADQEQREPQYEYGVKYSLSEEAHGEGKFSYRPTFSYSVAAEDVRSSGGTVVRRVKAGEWEEVE